VWGVAVLRAVDMRDDPVLRAVDMRDDPVLRAVDVRDDPVLRAVDMRDDPVLAVGDGSVDEGDSAEDFDVVGVDDQIEEVGGGSPVDDEVGDERPAALQAPATIASATMETGAHR
jgi:hypothetical protein